MPDFLPERVSETPSPVRRVQLARQQRQAELQVARHELRMWVESEKDQIDTHAAGNAIRYAFDEEIDLLDYGMLRADGSQTRQELLARKLEQFSAINLRRVQRRFGR